MALERYELFESNRAQLFPMKFDDFLAIFWWFGAILRKFHFGKFLNFSDFQKF